METRITDFIKRHHVLTLATAFDNLPWTANCFYAWMDAEGILVFTSDSDTRHIKDLEQGNEVAANIVLETKEIGKIRGIQLLGKLYEPEGELLKKSRRAYRRKFPYTALMDTRLWVLEVTYIKMTDNRLGFGKKLHWRRDSEE